MRWNISSNDFFVTRMKARIQPNFTQVNELAEHHFAGL